METTIIALEAAIIAILLCSIYVLQRKLTELSETLSQIAIFLGSLEIPETQEISFDGIREEIVSIMGEMSPPSFVDHIGGALASILQAKAMSQMHQISPDLLNQQHVDVD